MKISPLFIPPFIGHEQFGKLHPPDGDEGFVEQQAGIGSVHTGARGTPGSAGSITYAAHEKTILLYNHGQRSGLK